MTSADLNTGGMIFFSYRRKDSPFASNEFYKILVKRFGEKQVFKDIDNLRPGALWIRDISSTIEASDLVLAVIGPQWNAGRRLDKIDDPVRLEIEQALLKDVPLIPVLLDDAPVPRRDRLPASVAPLFDRNAAMLRPNQWEHDADELFDVIARELDLAKTRREADAAALAQAEAEAAAAAEARRQAEQERTTSEARQKADFDRRRALEHAVAARKAEQEQQARARAEEETQARGRAEKETQAREQEEARQRLNDRGQPLTQNPSWFLPVAGAAVFADAMAQGVWASWYLLPADGVKLLPALCFWFLAGPMAAYATLRHSPRALFAGSPLLALAVALMIPLWSDYSAAAGIAWFGVLGIVACGTVLIAKRGTRAGRDACVVVVVLAIALLARPDVWTDNGSGAELVGNLVFETAPIIALALAGYALYRDDQSIYSAVGLVLVIVMVVSDILSGALTYASWVVAIVGLLAPGFLWATALWGRAAHATAVKAAGTTVLFAAWALTVLALMILAGPQAPADQPSSTSSVEDSPTSAPPTPTPTPTPTAEVSPSVEPGTPTTARGILTATLNADAAAVAELEGLWTAQLSSSGPKDSAEDTLDKYRELKARYPKALLLWSADWPGSFGPSSQKSWVVVSGEASKKTKPILKHCKDDGWKPNECWAKRLDSTGDDPTINTDFAPPDKRNN